MIYRFGRSADLSQPWGRATLPNSSSLLQGTLSDTLQVYPPHLMLCSGLKGREVESVFIRILYDCSIQDPVYELPRILYFQAHT